MHEAKNTISNFDSLKSDPYLIRQIIAYIGNKRRLLPLIDQALDRVAKGRVEGLRFLDLFSGSGIVSRYARRRGMQVTANDWEPFTRVLNRAWLEPLPETIVRLFGDAGGLDSALRSLEDQPEPTADEAYLARYYAPASSDPLAADYRTERLFYTRANALILDAARNAVERRWPMRAGDDDRDLIRCLLLAPLIHAAATRVNTSGVFKAYHKGFGGHGRDALKRILSPVKLKPPLVIDALPGRVFDEDANSLAGDSELGTIDIAYLDPPYNQHQYGSNYHLLNTLVLWDRIPEPALLGLDGKLLRKAAIRSDWTRTRSAYCSEKTALKAFRELIFTLDAGVLLISYSTDGIIPFDTLRRVAEDRGRLSLSASPYVTYRGGRQSAARRNRNLEFLMVLEPGRRTRPVDRMNADKMLTFRKLVLLCDEWYHPERLAAAGCFHGEDWVPSIPGVRLSFKFRRRLRLVDVPDSAGMEFSVASRLVTLLEGLRCRSREEELDVMEQAWRENPAGSGWVIREIPRILRKLAHRKYRDIFDRHMNSLKAMDALDPPGFAVIRDELLSLEALAARRMTAE